MTRLRHLARGGLVAFAMLASGAGASAQEQLTTNETLTRLFTAEELNPDWFTELFRSQLPPAGLAELLATLTTE